MNAESQWGKIKKGSARSPSNPPSTVIQQATMASKLSFIYLRSRAGPTPFSSRNPSKVPYTETYIQREDIYKKKKDHAYEKDKYGKRSSARHHLVPSNFFFSLYTITNQTLRKKVKDVARGSPGGDRDALSSSFSLLARRENNLMTTRLFKK